MGSLAGDMETSCDSAPYLVTPTFLHRRFCYMMMHSVTRRARCGREMMGWKVEHPRYGVVYDELQAIKRGRYGPCRGSPPEAGADRAGAKAMTQLALQTSGYE